MLSVKQRTEGRRMRVRRAAGEQGDPRADGSAQGDDPEGVAVVDAARLFTAVAGPAQEALKPPIARVAGAVARPGSHRTVRTLVVYGSSGRRVMTPAAGRLIDLESSP